MDLDNPTTVEKPEQTSSARKAGSVLQQLGLNMLMVGLLALLAFLVYQRFISKPGGPGASLLPGSPLDVGASEPINLAGGGEPLVDLTPLATPQLVSGGIVRKTNLKTIIPSRPRVEVITYTVQAGDTLFSIAQNYNLKPETVLWGNFDVLNDNPHLLKPDQVLNILPVDGTYYQWQEGDTLSGVAAFFQVEPPAIVNYTGNFFDLTQMDGDGTDIEPGTWLIIPGGKRAIRDWGPPAITRDNPASARYYGEGHCGDIYDGAYGTGTFVWPTTDHGISGYAFDPGVHPAIDIAGQEGNPIYATDSGVVVYAGWSDYGYGLLIVVDHGNGWQSAYAHLSSVAVTCGQSVYQSGFIGGLGSTGNSSGPHLHFELAINGAKVNPYDYVR